MAVEYSVEVCKTLKEEFHTAALYRPMRVSRYDPGDELRYDVIAIGSANTAKLCLVVEKFVGGGFAGQVYKVRLVHIESENSCIPGLETGGTYAMKILVPPAYFAQIFRNALYWLGFQGPFQLQVNPVAVRTDALWQKFIRRAAKIRFGDETKVVDVHATFVDQKLGSCGEISEWVQGRTWRLEVDEHVDLLKRWQKGKTVGSQKIGSPEYRTKYIFMHDFVKLLHEIGAYEFARQYEWTTLKSQPNCLKRTGTEAEPEKGLVAVDFCAGLALLPFLPMSPGDIKLIFQGIKRGSFVQFDRGNLNKLKIFIGGYKEHFSDMQGLLDKLVKAEDIYRNSVPDITHNHIRLLSSSKLWGAIFDSAITGWKVRNIIDEKGFEKLRASRGKTFLFFLLGLLPILGKVLRRFFYHSSWRRHYISILTSAEYFKKAIKGRAMELLASWHRTGRISQEKAKTLLQQPWKIFYHLPFLLLISPGLHRFFTDRRFAKEKLYHFTVRPVRLYFNAELRRQWLLDMVSQGKKKHILSDEDADTILSQIDEPFIQKYLRCLAVHICMLPVTHIVAVTVAVVYWLMHRSNPNAWVVGLGIIAAFQLVPVSPGSLARGLYVVYMAIKDKSFKDYDIAVFLGFLKYVGYLAFPIQMTYRYPALARFMAAHWATDAVHIIPVFGERGALLEHWVFYLFYNWPLTIRRRMRKRAEIRASIKPRYWHVGLCIAAVVIILGLADFAYLLRFGQLPPFNSIRWILLMIPMPMFCGVAVTLGCAGAPLWKRTVSAAASGAVVGLLYTAISVTLANSDVVAPGQIIVVSVWQLFVFTVFATVGAIFTELKLPDPDLV